MLDPKILKQIALAKKSQEKATTPSTESLPSFTLNEVEKYSKELESFVSSFAEDGHLSVEYCFNDTHPLPLLYAVAQYFKDSNPKMMVITSEGQKKITVTWDGMNHV
jgi:hypothetical protein